MVYVHQRMIEQEYSKQTTQGSDWTMNGPEKYGENDPRMKLTRIDVNYMRATVHREISGDVPRVQPTTDPSEFNLHKGDTLFIVPGETSSEAFCIGTLNGITIPSVTSTDPTEQIYERRRLMEEKIELVGDITSEKNCKDAMQEHEKIEVSAFRGGGHDSTINNGCFHIRKGEILMKLPPMLNSDGTLAQYDGGDTTEWGDLEFIEAKYGGYHLHPGNRRPLILVPVREKLIPKINGKNLTVAHIESVINVKKNGRI